MLRCAQRTHEVENKVSLFERPFKIRKDGVFGFAISSLVGEIFKFSHYANYEMMTL